ncbi:MAG: signal peptidase I [Clostridia bacterium]|nr:signal peptidase I [Clostridia bacterium]
MVILVNDTTQDAKNAEVSVAARVFNVLSTVFVYLLAACILIGAVLFAFNASPTKSIFGYRYYTVLTPSMSPSYEVGDVVFVHIEDSDTINEGDVITFNPSADSEAYLTHRVTEKIENYEGTGVTCFRTKGDANDSEDSFLIDEEKVIGKVVFGIPKLGYIIRFVQLRWYYIAAITAMIVVFIYLLKRYFKAEDDDDDRMPEAAGGAGEANSEKTE